jgi:hypothetical protein
MRYVETVLRESYCAMADKRKTQHSQLRKACETQAFRNPAQWKAIRNYNHVQCEYLHVWPSPLRMSKGRGGSFGRPVAALATPLDHTYIKFPRCAYSLIELNYMRISHHLSEGRGLTFYHSNATVLFSFSTPPLANRKIGFFVKCRFTNTLVLVKVCLKFLWSVAIIKYVEISV